MADGTINAASFQPSATLAIGPSFIGWSLQLLLSGATLNSAVEHLNPATTTFARPTRYILGAVLSLLLCITGLTFFEVFYWGSLQATELDDLYQFTVPDAIVSIPTGLLASIVQAFFAERAWKVLHKNFFFLIVVGVSWLAALAGAMAVAVESLRPQDMESSFYHVMVTTQVWLWASAFVDLCISIVLVASLYKYSDGADGRSNDTFTWLAQLAFQTSALTTIFALGASLSALLTYKDATASIYYSMQYPIPSVYAFSYVWCLSKVATVRKKRLSSGNLSTSVCTQCQNPNYEIWPYPATQASLPALNRLHGLDRPAVDPERSSISFAAFLNTPQHTCRRSRAGKGRMPFEADSESKEDMPSTVNLPGVLVDIDVAEMTEQRSPERSPPESPKSNDKLPPRDSLHREEC